MTCPVPRKSAKDWADHLVENVSGATQLHEEELANVEDWRRNAEKLFAAAIKQTIEEINEAARRIIRSGKEGRK